MKRLKMCESLSDYVQVSVHTESRGWYQGQVSICNKNGILTYSEKVKTLRLDPVDAIKDAKQHAIDIRLQSNFDGVFNPFEGK